MWRERQGSIVVRCTGACGLRKLLIRTGSQRSGFECAEANGGYRLLDDAFGADAVVTGDAFLAGGSANTRYSCGATLNY